MMLKGATSVAAVAAIGNLLQGWDGGAIAGKGQLIIYVDLNHASYLYHTNEFWHSSVKSATNILYPSYVYQTTMSDT